MATLIKAIELGFVAKIMFGIAGWRLLFGYMDYEERPAYLGINKAKVIVILVFTILGIIFEKQAIYTFIHIT